MTYNGQVDSTTKNLLKAGEFFMYSLWIQSQMTDLIILRAHPRIIKRFVARPARIPATLRDERMRLWTQDFTNVKRRFEEAFGATLSAQAKADFDHVYALRNAIAHSYVSLGRDYILYRPSGRRKRTMALMKIFGTARTQESATPTLFKLSFADDRRFGEHFAAIQRLDQQCFKSIANALGIPHSRIR